MRGIAFEVAGFQQSSLHSNNLKESNFGFNSNNEPISVLDTRSPSPSTSSSMGGGGNGSTTTTPPLLAVSGNKLQQKSPESVVQERGVNGCVAYTTVAGEGRRKDEWPQLQSIPAEFELQQQGFGVGLEDWERLLSGVISSPAREQSLRWISGEFDDIIDQNAPTATMYEAPPVTNFNPQNPNLFPFCNPVQKLPVVLNHLPPPPVQFHHHQNLQKSFVSDMGLHKVSILNQGFQKVSILNQDQELLLEKPSMVAGIKQEPTQTSPTHHHHNHQHHHNQQQQLICNQLLAAAELMLSGNHSHAQGILARLNHQFASAATATTPFQRAAFCFKEAMQMQMQTLLNLNPNRVTSPSHGVFKMGAYKMFSEVSPVVQFMNFTSNQTLLEALGDAKNIHIIDFDIGFGAQWASFIQELPIRNNDGGDGEGCSLKITAFASPSTHHPVELGLMHENLSRFAQEIGISFKLEVVNFDSFDPRWFSVSDNETVAVNFPIWSACSHLSAIPLILHFVKQLSPRIVVSLDRGCERTDLPFPHYLLRSLQYYEVLLDSIDGANVVSDASNKIERYLFQPQVEQTVMGKLQYPEPMPHWKSLFTAGGYSPVRFSNFAETQAECVLKRMQVQEFRVEKRQASLVLCWKDRVLMTASAWTC